MSDSLTQQVANLLKRLGKHFNRKIAETLLVLVNHKSAGSLGAIAGFAIAVIFTWKFWRYPGRPQRNQRKETDSASNTAATRANEVASSTADCQSLLNVEDVEPTDDFQSSTKLTLGQIVRKKLNGSRKMTCQLLGVILEESSAEELLEHATVRPAAVEVLLEISKSCDIFLMERILDDQSGERVLLALDNAGLFKTGGLMKDKVLFCSTDNGRTSFVRQLEPEWHVDTNPDILSQLSRFIRYQLHISPARLSFAGSSMFSSTSLECYFAEERVS